MYRGKRGGLECGEGFGGGGEKEWEGEGGERGDGRERGGGREIVFGGKGGERESVCVCARARQTVYH